MHPLALEILQDIRKSHRSLVIDPNELILGDILGTGTTGEVVMGLLHGTKVAVKRYHPHVLVRSSGLDEFKSEVSTMMNLVHPNIMLLLGFSITNNRLSIVSEFVHCGSLSNLLYDKDVALLISATRRLDMAMDIARGMAYLHSQSPAIVHRDLKPSNLLVDSNWRVKICDVSSLCFALCCTPFDAFPLLSLACAKLWLVATYPPLKVWGQLNTLALR
jgi:serine/threonine protein kinase